MRAVRSPCIAAAIETAASAVEKVAVAGWVTLPAAGWAPLSAAWSFLARYHEGRPAFSSPLIN